MSESALVAFVNPLRFAARNAFANLERVKNLESTLRDALERARPSIETSLHQALAEAIPRDHAEPEERRAGITKCLELAGAASAPSEQPVSAPVHAPKRSMPSAPTPTPVELPPDPGVALDTSVQWIKGVGPRVAELLGQRGIRTVHDLLLFLPRRYEDRSGARRIADAPVGRGVVVEGEVVAQGSKFIKGRRRLEVVLGDDSGHVRLVWFRVPRGSFA
ncbi:MAG: hypothetical protein AAF658_19945, partial [Myxococcota bacterium]